MLNKCEWKSLIYKKGVMVSSMIHSARPMVTPAAKIAFCFVFLDLKSGDVRTDNMCENNDPYRPWLGRVDQQSIFY